MNKHSETMKTTYLILILTLMTNVMVNAQGFSTKIIKNGREFAEMYHHTTHSTLLFKNAVIRDNQRADSCQRWVAVNLDSDSVQYLYELLVNHKNKVRGKYRINTLGGKTIIIEYDRDGREVYPILNLYDGDQYYRMQYMTKELYLLLFNK